MKGEGNNPQVKCSPVPLEEEIRGVRASHKDLLRKTLANYNNKFIQPALQTCITRHQGMITIL